MQIADRSFLVAGGGSGLGAATTRELVLAGGKVVVADLNRVVCEALAGELHNAIAEGAVKFIETDVTDAASVEQAVQAAVSDFASARFGGAVNCAGILAGSRVVGKEGPHDLALFQRVIEINLVGTFNVVRLAAAALSVGLPDGEGERGVIVNTASVAAFEGQIGQVAYSASKAGVVGMTLPLARELARFGIRVMTIAPGTFDTPMVASMTEEVRRSLGEQVPFPPRLGRPSEYAALVRHIFENRMLNGDVIRLDDAIRMGPK